MTTQQQINNLNFEIDLILKRKNEIKKIENPTAELQDEFKKLSEEKAELEMKRDDLLLNI